MPTLKKYIPFFASALLMYVVLLVIYPHYRYYIDPDGTAYLTISRRYANGDYARAINGYWSPWSCWLTALLIKAGISAIPASVTVNALGATGFLYISQSFFLRFGIRQTLQWLLCTTLALFLCYAVFWQSFDDLWECFFLLGTLRLMTEEGFRNRPMLWVLCGVAGTLAYFAKAYSFPFFILNTICCAYFICKGDKVQWLKVSATAIGTMVICSLPWILALHNKYGTWTTSTSGPLNMSWYLVGHPQWKPGIDLLIPPAYPDSPYYWEDPYLANGDAPHFWSSLHLFGLQFLRGGQNLLKLLLSMLQLSVIFPFIAVMLIRFITNKKTRVATAPAFVLALSFLLFPLGYLPINFEARYIWYMLPLGMLAGGLFIQNHLQGKKAFYKAVPFLFAASFLIYPLWGMIKMYDAGADDNKIAGQLKSMGVTGPFTSNAKPGIEAQRIERIAYFSGNQLYSVRRPVASYDELIPEMDRYHVGYLIVFNDTPDQKIPEGMSKRLSVVPGIGIYGLTVWKIN